MRAAIMPSRFDEALEAVGEYVERCGNEDDHNDVSALGTLRGTFASWCERLAAVPASPSLDHNDLHPWNILVTGADGTNQARFYDWGDSIVAHPFASMLGPLGYVQHHLEVGLDDPAFLRIRVAYLDVSATLHRMPNPSRRLNSPALWARRSAP